MIFFQIFKCCYITRGVYRSCLFDIERNIYCSISNSFCDILERGYIEEEDSANVKLVEFLERENFIKYTKEQRDSSLYMDDIEFYTPFIFDDIVIDVDNLSKLEFIVNSIKPHYFETIQIRFFSFLSKDDLIYLVEFMRSKEFNSIELIFNHHSRNQIYDYKLIYEQFRIITKMVIMGFPTDSSFSIEDMFFVENRLTSSKQCGQICDKLFCVNIRQIATSKKFNTCLYKKIAIDLEGNIKNCPSMLTIYGNIKDTSIDNIIGNTEFEKYWYLTKDKIDTCKECEFKHICTDCRAFTERTFIDDDGMDYSKPLKCGYDPYTGKWNDWRDNHIKKKAIKFYDLEENVQ